MANTNNVPKRSGIYDLREADSPLEPSGNRIIVENTIITILNFDVENLAKYFYRSGIRLA